MAKLNQIIAVSKGQKGRTQSRLTEAYHKIQKKDLLTGISRTYRPKDEDGDRYPPESKQVNYTVRRALTEVSEALTQLFDVVATQDDGNTMARADVVVDGTTVLSQLPATTLLFLEKQLTDLHTVVSKLPVLDPAQRWEYSDEADCYATEPTETVKTKKVPRNHIKYEATKEHPAQVETYNEDVVIGYWTKVDFSGAVPESVRNNLLARVEKLQDAVKLAREQANMQEVDQVKIGDAVFGYLLDGIA